MKLYLTAAGTAAKESDGTFGVVVRLSAGATSQVQVNFSTVFDTASDSDIGLPLITDSVFDSGAQKLQTALNALVKSVDPYNGVLVFAPGEISKEIRFALTNDAKTEANEQFHLNFSIASSATNVRLAQSRSDALILDDDTSAGSPGTVNLVRLTEANTASPTSLTTDNLILGTAELESVRYAAPMASYQISKTDSSWRISSKTATGQSDTLLNVDRLQFTDVNLALDLATSAGEVAKTLGAVFGKSSVGNKEYAGIGLYYSDTLNYSYTQLMQLAITARLGVKPSHDKVVDLLYTNVVGHAPDPATRKSFTDLLDNQTYTVASIGTMAADTSLNKTNIQLTGLEQSGLAYWPLSGQ
ncbi:Calx-beta domain-containing protein [Limnohabitans sp.]|uniref:Calx-beta domain-containing protein n=1 Tax=Limnohabitans sp. TaxID=1907725 RepID=UPI002AFDED6B|nr:Calx-beta domain-containing protein [Limnohabitans sp.]